MLRLLCYLLQVSLISVVVALCMVSFYPLKQRCNLQIFIISVFDQTIKLITRRYSATHLSCINAVVHQRTFFQFEIQPIRFDCNQHYFQFVDPPWHRLYFLLSQKQNFMELNQTTNSSTEISFMLPNLRARSVPLMYRSHF